MPQIKHLFISILKLKYNVRAYASVTASVRL